MGRRLLVCAPLASAALLVGCLRRPSNSGQAKGDAGARGDGAHGGSDAARPDGGVPSDGMPPMDAVVPTDGTITGGTCPGPIDTFAAGSCGNNGTLSGTGNAMATGGTLTMYPGASCAWSASFGGGVLVHISMGPLPSGNSVTLHVGKAAISATSFGAAMGAGRAPASFGMNIALAGGSTTMIASFAAYVVVAPNGTSGTSTVYAGTGSDVATMTSLGTTTSAASGMITFDSITATTTDVQFDQLLCQ